MKKNLKLMAVVIFMAASASCFSQAGIYMFSTNLPGEITAGVHAGESPVTSISRSYENTGAAPTSSGLTILKSYSKPSLTLKDALWKQTNLSKVELRFYNASDVLYYKITMGAASGPGGTLVVESFIESAELCPANCPGISEQIKFRFQLVKEEDVLANTFKCWSFVQQNSTCPN